VRLRAVRRRARRRPQEAKKYMALAASRLVLPGASVAEGAAGDGGGASSGAPDGGAMRLIEAPHDEGNPSLT